MPSSDCFLWNCIKLAPLSGCCMNCQPRRYYFRAHDFIFAYTRQPSPNPTQSKCDYSFWYFAWPLRFILAWFLPQFLCIQRAARQLPREKFESIAFLLSNTPENFSITSAWKLFSILLMSLTPETVPGALSWPLVTCCMCCPASSLNPPQLWPKLRPWG